MVNHCCCWLDVHTAAVGMHFFFLLVLISRPSTLSLSPFLHLKYIFAFVLVQSRCRCSSALHHLFSMTDLQSPVSVFFLCPLTLFIWSQFFISQQLPRDLPVTVNEKYSVCHSAGAWLSLFSQGLFYRFADGRTLAHGCLMHSRRG